MCFRLNMIRSGCQKRKLREEERLRKENDRAKCQRLTLFFSKFLFHYMLTQTLNKPVFQAIPQPHLQILAMNRQRQQLPL